MWFKKIIDCGICDHSRSGMVIVDDLRPEGQRRKYGMILGQKKKGGMGFISNPGDDSRRVEEEVEEEEGTEEEED